MRLVVPAASRGKLSQPCVNSACWTAWFVWKVQKNTVLFNDHRSSGATCNHALGWPSWTSRRRPADCKLLSWLWSQDHIPLIAPDKCRDISSNPPCKSTAGRMRHAIWKLSSSEAEWSCNRSMSNCINGSMTYSSVACVVLKATLMVQLNSESRFYDGDLTLLVPSWSRWDWQRQWRRWCLYSFITAV